MKKITLIALSAVLLSACGSEESKDKTSESSAEASTPVATGKDAELTKWLSGKILVSTEKDPKYDMWNNLSLKADGTCTDKDNAAAKWSVKDCKFIFESVMNITKDLEKRAADTLVFKGEIGDAVYVLKSIN